MQNVMNRRWLLTSYPEGMPAPANWIMDTQPVPDPGAGQILVKAKWLSVDPYMRGRMSPATNYTKGVAIGEVMQGGGVGEVVVSYHPAWKVGDVAESMSYGWQEWSVLMPDITFLQRQERLANWSAKSPNWRAVVRSQLREATTSSNGAAKSGLMPRSTTRRPPISRRL